MDCGRSVRKKRSEGWEEAEVKEMSEMCITEAGNENTAISWKCGRGEAKTAAEAGIWKEGAPGAAEAGAWKESAPRAAGEYDYRTKEKTEEIEAVRKCMLLHLEQMKQCGVALYLDGQSVLPGEAVAKAVRENSPYMADYVLDSAGVIQQVRFDKVTRC